MTIYFIKNFSLRLFGRYHGKSDLLFKDSAKGLKSLSEDTTDERMGKKKYFKALEDLHTCESKKELLIFKLLLGHFIRSQNTYCGNNDFT